MRIELAIGPGVAILDQREVIGGFGGKAVGNLVKAARQRRCDLVDGGLIDSNGLLDFRHGRPPSNDGDRGIAARYRPSRALF